jgi:hypothetical protein
VENSDTSYYIFNQRREQYLHVKQALFSEYVQQETLSKEQNLFFSFNSSADTLHSVKKEHGIFSVQDLKTLLSPSLIDTHNGGYFLRWNQKGIAINPSEEFLERFCALGQHLWDIDYVVVTSPEQNIQLELIYALNRELNNTLVSYEQEPHVITYLLHPRVYAEYAARLRPQFREERGSLICLETFQDGHGQECCELDPKIKLWYAKAGSGTALMIRLELCKEVDGKPVSFGYITNSSWDAFCSSFFKECSVLLLGFGQTSPEDLEKISTQTSNVGYYGLARALEELEQLEVLLVGEFSPCQGDIRLEIIKKLKKETSQNLEHQTIFPVEHGFILDLETMRVKTGTHKLPPYQFSDRGDVAVVRCEGSFSSLVYLSEEQIL